MQSNLLDEISLPNVLEEVKNGEQVTVVCGGKTFKPTVRFPSASVTHCLQAARCCMHVSRTSKPVRARQGSRAVPLDSHIFFC